MPTIQLTQFAQAIINGSPYIVGELDTPFSITIAGDIHKRTFSAIAALGTVKLWDATENIADFDLAMIRCDLDLILELVTDQNAGVGIEQYTIGLKGSGTANTWGPWFVLSRDDSYANYTINFGGGTLDVIDLMRAKNLSASVTAMCEVHMFT